jgi:hypothetical protein
MRRAPAGWCLLLALLLIAGGADAPAQTVRLHIVGDSVTVGDRFRIAVVAEHNFMSDAQFPALPDTVRSDTSAFASAPLLRFGDLEVLGREAFDGRYGGTAQPGTRIDSVVYDVTTFALDSATVSPIPVQFTAGEDTFTVPTRQAVLPVLSLVPPDAQGLKPLAPLAEFPRPLWPWFLLALAVIVLIATLLYYLRERREQQETPLAPPPPPPVPPYDEAVQRLQQLESSLDPHDAKQVKPFFVELADVLRTYLEARVHVPALESTTREVTERLEARSAHDGVPDEASSRVYSVLALADLVKFADLKPPPAQSDEAVSETRAVLDLIEQGLVRQEQTMAPPASTAHPDRPPVPSDA